MLGTTSPAGTEGDSAVDLAAIGIGGVGVDTRRGGEIQRATGAVDAATIAGSGVVVDRGVANAEEAV